MSCPPQSYPLLICRKTLKVTTLITFGISSLWDSLLWGRVITFGRGGGGGLAADRQKIKNIYLQKPWAQSVLSGACNRVLMLFWGVITFVILQYDIIHSYLNSNANRPVSLVRSFSLIKHN